MPSLPTSPIDFKAKARYHLGLSSEAASEGERALLEQRMDNIPDVATLEYIMERVERCHRAWRRTEFGADYVAPTPIIESELVSTEIYAGDITRSQRNNRVPNWRERQKYYRAEVDALARELGVKHCRFESVPTRYA